MAWLIGTLTVILIGVVMVAIRYTVTDRDMEGY